MPYRPTIVEVMAEYSGVVLWNRSPGCEEPTTDPDVLGISPELGSELRAWNAEFGRLALDERFEFASPAAELAWRRRGRELAHRVQNELGPDVDVLYRQLGDDRPIREQRGP